jgi:pyruvate/2-oxoglutarate dehydrogenase complex dihydrolipoamide acyltransferase (E2) component
MNPEPDYVVKPISRMRRFSIDAGRLGRRRHTIHGLLEMDVTEARRRLREHRERTGERPSFTAFVIACLAQAVAANREVHAHRNWRNRLVIFRDVNVNTMIEVEMDGRRIPMPFIIEAADRKSYWEIHQALRAVQREPAGSGESRFMRWFLWLPWPLRRAFYWVAQRNPQLFRSYQSSVLVTAVGMFGEGGGWGIPVANFPLTVTLGGIAQKPGVIDGRIEVREVLDVTVSLDHDVVDGAPAARFVQQFRALVERAHGLEALPGAGEGPRA